MKKERLYNMLGDKEAGVIIAHIKALYEISNEIYCFYVSNKLKRLHYESAAPMRLRNEPEVFKGLVQRYVDTLKLHGESELLEALQSLLDKTSILEQALDIFMFDYSNGEELVDKANDLKAFLEKHFDDVVDVCD